MVYRGPSELGIGAVRISTTSSGEPDWLYAAEPGSIEDYARSDHPISFRAVRGVLHAPAYQARLRVGRLVLARRGLFYVPILVSTH